MFAVFAPPGRSRYGQSIAWAPFCIIAGIILIPVFLFGFVVLALFVPFLLLMYLDKLNLSRRRMWFILQYTFLKLFWMFELWGILLGMIWIVIAAVSIASSYFMGPNWYGAILACLFFPLQSVFAVLLYESILGRENLDVDLHFRVAATFSKTKKVAATRNRRKR